MHLPIRSWKNTLSSLGVKIVERKPKGRKPAIQRKRTLGIESLEPRQMMTVAPSGSEFLLNTYTTNDQKQWQDSGRGIAAVADGHFVGAWTSTSQDGDTYGIYGQRFDGQNTKLGSEFRANTTTNDAQKRSSISTDTSGNFVIVWEGSGQDGNSTGVFGQRYNATGSAQGSEFQINVTTNNSQELPEVAHFSDGGFVVSWSGKGSGDVSGVFVRRFNASGVAQTSEILVNTHTDNQQSNATIATFASGGFVVAWESGGSQDGDGLGVYAQRFDSSNNKTGSEFLVNTTTNSLQQNASVASASDGQFVIVWQSNLQDGNGLGIYGQRYNASGQTVGSEFQINNYSTGDQQNPSVAFGPDGGFLVAWNGKGSEDNAGIYAREYDSSGQALGNQFLVNTTTSNSQVAPTVAGTSSGYVIDWSGYGMADTHGDGVYAQRFERVNVAPTTSGIGNITVNEDASPTVINLWAAFADEHDADAQLTYSIVSNSNPSLFSSTPISAPNGTLTLNYTSNASGQADITVRATDTGGLIVETAFHITVVAVNDTPTSSGIANVTTNEDVDPSDVNLFNAFSDVENTDNQLTYTVTGNSNPQLFTAVTVVAATGMLVFDLAANKNGQSHLKIRATDTGGLFTETEFDVTVNPVNDNPTTSDIEGLTVNEDASPTVIDLSNAFSDIEDTPQQLTYSVVSNTNSSLFSSTPISQQNGTLILNYALNAYGQADITVRATDTGGLHSDTAFHVTVNAVNDQPTTSGLTAVTVNEDANPSVVDLYGAFADVENSDAQLTYSLTGNTNTALFSSTAIDGQAGTLTLAYVANAFGEADITVRATDTGGLYRETILHVTVNAVNDQPLTTGIANFSVPDGSQPTVLDLFGAFSDVEDADNQLAYMLLDNSNPTLFTSTPIDGQAGTLTLNYATSANGIATITVRATDSGGLFQQFGFQVTVGKPTTSGIADVTVNEDAAPTAISLWEAFADNLTPDNQLIYSLTANSNAALFSSTPINSQTGTLTLNYAANANGQSTLTVRATDAGGLFVETTFHVTVNPVNDAPVFTSIDPGSVDENGSHEIIGTFTDVDLDPDAYLTVNWGSNGGHDEGSSNAEITPDPVIADKYQFVASHQYLDDNPTNTPFDIYNLTFALHDGANTVTSFETREDTSVTVPTSGLVHWWAGDGSTVDSAGTDHADAGASITFPLGYAPPGKAQFQAFKFDGTSTSTIDLGFDSSGATISNAFSISMWVKTSATQEQVLIAKRLLGNNAQAYWELRMLSNGLLRFELMKDGGGVPDQSIGASSGAINDDSWHHVVAIRSGAAVHIFVDGARVATKTASSAASLASNSAKLMLGGSPDVYPESPLYGSVHVFNGLMDEVRIYNRALTFSTTNSNDTTQEVGRLRFGVAGQKSQVGIQVRNVQPFDLNLGPVCVDGTDVEVSGQFSDPGTLDTHTVKVNWGDSTATDNQTLSIGTATTFEASHSYADVANQHVVRLISVNDDDNTTSPLVGWWAGDFSTSQLVDLTASGNNAALKNSATFVDGKFGKALRVSPGATAALANVAEFTESVQQTIFQGSKGMTIDGWVYIEPGSSSGGTIFSSTRTITGGIGRDAVTLKDNSFDITLHSLTGSQYSTAVQHATFTALEKGKWLYVALVWDKTQAEAYLYVNGEKVQLTANGVTDDEREMISGGYAGGPKIVTFGAQKTSSTNYSNVLNGKLDEWRFWKTPLSQDEIKSVYAGGDVTAGAHYRYVSPVSNPDSDSTHEKPLQIYTRPISVEVGTGNVIFRQDRGPDANAGDSIQSTYRMTSNGHPIVTVDYTVPTVVPGTIEAKLTFGGIENDDSVFYDLSGASAGETIQLVLQAEDVSALPSGHYQFQVEVTEHGTTDKTKNIFGTAEIINRDDSVFGHGWWVDSVDRIITGEDDYYSSYDGGGYGVTLVRGDGTAGWFAQWRTTEETETNEEDVEVTTRTIEYISPNGSFTKLKRIEVIEDGDEESAEVHFELSHPNGTVDRFDEDGLLTDRTDRNDNVIHYAYTDSNPSDSDDAEDDLSTITDVYGLTTTYTYDSSGYLEQVEDFAERHTDYTIDGDGYLMEIDQPDPDDFTSQGGSNGSLTSPETTFEYYVGSEFEDAYYAGQLKHITLPEGNETEITYGDAGRFDSATSADDTSWSLTPTAVSGLRDAPSEGEAADPVFAEDIKATYTNERSKDWTYTVDRMGYKTSMTDPLEFTWIYARDCDGLMTSMTEPAGGGGTLNLAAQTTSYSYDSRGNLLQVTYPQAKLAGGGYISESWEYDEDFSQVTLHTDPRGYKTINILDDHGNVTEIRQQVDIEAEEYVDDDPNQWITTKFEYTDSWTETIDPETSRNLPGGLVTLMTDPRGINSRTEYYVFGDEDVLVAEHGLVKTVKSGLGPDEEETGTTIDGILIDASIQHFEYDAARNMNVFIQQMGDEDDPILGPDEGDDEDRRTDYQYDNLNRLITVTMPAATNVMPDGTIENDDRAVIRYEYNGEDFKTAQILEMGQDVTQETVYTPDPMNRLEFLTQPEALQYNESDPSSPTSESPITEYIYDDAGNLDEVIDPLGRSITYVYNDRNEQTEIHKPATSDHDESVTKLAYDSVGNLKSVRDPLDDGYGSRETSYQYDALHRKTKETRPSPGTHPQPGVGTPHSAPFTVFVYDDSSNLVSSYDALQGVGGADRTTDNVYDGLNRLIEQDLPEPSSGEGKTISLFTFDGAGNRVGIRDANLLWTYFEYDSMNRSDKVIAPATSDHDSPVTKLVYNDAGEGVQRSELTDATTNSYRDTFYEYDAMGRSTVTLMPEVTDPEASEVIKPSMSTLYDRASNVRLETDAEGKTIAKYYDALNRPIMMAQARPDAPGSPELDVTTDPNDLYDAGFSVATDAFDVASQAREHAEYLKNAAGSLSIRVTTNNYDEQGMLSQTLDPPVDLSGSFVRPQTDYRYDAAGNLQFEDTKITSTKTLTTENVYDNLNRLVKKIEPPDQTGNPSTITFHVYDIAGREIISTDSLGRKTQYVYDNLDRNIKTIFPPVLYKIVDQGNSSFITTGTGWAADSTNGPAAHEGNQKYRAAGTGDGSIHNTATWTFSDLQPGRTYAVYVTWQGTGAAAARFSVNYNGTTTNYSINQSAAPSGYTADNRPWTQLAASVSITSASSTLTVQLNDGYANGVSFGNILADAVALVDLAPSVGSQYDKENFQIAESDAEGRLTQYVRDDNYQTVQTIGPETLVFDATTSDFIMASATTTSTMDILGRVSEYTDPLDRVTSYLFDNLDRNTQVTMPAVGGFSPISYSVYSLTGDLLSSTDPMNNVTKYRYDNQHRQTTVIAPVDDPGASPIDIIVDDTADYGIAFTFTGPDSWTPVLGSGGFGDNYHTIAQDSGLNAANWTFSDLIPGRQYEIFVTWKEDAGNATDAPFSVFDGVTLEKTFDIDQTQAPTADLSEFGTDWQSLGLFVISSDSAKVVLTDANVEADAVRIIERPPTSTTFYNAAGQVIQSTDPLGRVTQYEYDDAGRTLRIIHSDPDGDGPEQAPVELFTYNLYGEMLSQTQVMGDEDSDPGRSLGDPDDLVTSFVYDDLHRKIEEIDANGDSTFWRYDLEGNLSEIEDAVSNTTDYFYDEFNRVTMEVVTVDSTVLTRYFQYDLNGNLTEKIDRNGRITDFAYDDADRLTTETWVDNGIVTNTITSTYDLMGRLHSVSDDFSIYTYSYDELDRMTSVDNTGTPGVTSVILSSGYDLSGQRTDLSAIIDGEDDFANAYTYNGRNQLTQVLQQGQIGGNTVAYKRVELVYDSADQVDQIRRYASSGTGDLVATSSFAYDGNARLKELTHAQGITTLAHYAWLFDQANRIMQFDSDTDGTADYNYDDRGQLTGATYTDYGGFQDDESYTYDENGNRTNAGYSTGDQNRLTSDGTFDYTYDNEGNRIRRTNIETDQVTVYTWDNRNRLVKVTDYNSTEDADNEADPVRIITQTYDVNNRWIGRAIDADGEGSPEHIDRMVYDGNQVVLKFSSNTGEDIVANELSHRYLWGQAVDQLLADEELNYVPPEEDQNERFDLSTPGTVLWALTDNLGSVRDTVQYDAGTDDTTVANHVTYDTFGNITQETADYDTNDQFFYYTGRPFDKATNLQNNLNRWYDSTVGRFMSEDTVGFQAADSNLYRYVKNAAPNSIDPTGNYDIGGHFYTTYVVAVATRKYTDKQAFELAYYSQLPDQVKKFDAAEQGKEYVLNLPTKVQEQLNQEFKKLADEVAKAAKDVERDVMDLTDNLMAIIGMGDAPQPRAAPARVPARDSKKLADIQRQKTWAEDIFNWIHSMPPYIKEETDAAGLKRMTDRRSLLFKMIRDKQFAAPWKKGILIHAYGDAFAHQRNKGQPYHFPLGHFNPSFTLGHEIDLIRRKPQAYRSYVINLFHLLGGRNDKDELLLGILDNADPKKHKLPTSIDAETKYMKDFASGPNYRYDAKEFGYEPNENHNTFEGKGLPTPDPIQMRELINEMKDYADGWRRVSG